MWKRKSEKMLPRSESTILRLAQDSRYSRSSAAWIRYLPSVLPSSASTQSSCLGIGVKLSALAVEMKRISCSGTRTEVSRTRSPDPPNAENVSSSHRLAGRAAKIEIERGLRFYEVLFQTTANLSWAQVSATAAQFEPLLSSDWPDYCTEMKGMADRHELLCIGP